MVYFEVGRPQIMKHRTYAAPYHEAHMSMCTPLRVESTSNVAQKSRTVKEVSE